MNDLHLRARHYFLEVESNRLPVWHRLLLWAFVATCLAVFVWKICYFFGTLFSDWPNGKPEWLAYGLALACEMLVGGAFLYSIQWKRRAFLKHYQALRPDRGFQEVDQVKTFFLEKFTGCSPDGFFGLYKEFAAVQAALKASRHSPAVNSRELLSLIYDPEGKARIWTLLSIFCSVFSALALAKLTDPGDFVALMTRRGWEFYKVLFALAFIVVGSTLFLACLAQDSGRAILAWVLARFSRWGVGRDDVLNYFMRDLLRFSRTKLPDLDTAWPVLPYSKEISANLEAVDVPPETAAPPLSTPAEATPSSSAGAQKSLPDEGG